MIVLVWVTFSQFYEDITYRSQNKQITAHKDY